MIQQIKNRLQRIKVNFKRFGLINTIKYLIRNAIIKRPVNQLNYYLKKKQRCKILIQIY